MAQIMKREKVFSAKPFLESKPPTFIVKGVEFLNCGCDLRRNLVTVKNIKSGEYKEIDFYNEFQECDNSVLLPLEQ